MRIIYFTKYTEAGPSSRYRSYQYFPYFYKEGIEITVKPFFTSAYIETLYKKGKKNLLGIIPRFIQRFFQVLFLKKYDIIFIEAELFPYTPLFLERILLWGKKNIILDYDDAIFHNYDRPGNYFVNALCGKKIYKLAGIADTVITGSPYLTKKLKPYSKQIFEIPTSIIYKKYDAVMHQPATIKNEIFRIGWIGSKTTSPNVISIKEALLRLQQQYNVELALIGFDKQLLSQLDGVRYKYFEWNKDTEIDLIRSFDAGIMPLDNTDFNNGKCGFKLIQYMACGVPTISTPLEVNVKINRCGHNLHAATIDEWVNGLAEIINRKEYFKNNVGYENRQIVHEYYSAEKNYMAYLSVFNSFGLSEKKNQTQP